jgi:hypothetical protein
MKPMAEWKWINHLSLLDPEAHVRYSMFDIRFTDRIGFCWLRIWEAPAARNVYSSGEKKLASSVRSDI